MRKFRKGGRGILGSKTHFRQYREAVSRFARPHMGYDYREPYSTAFAEFSKLYLQEA